MAYRDVTVWLEDIVIAIEKIKAYTKNIASSKEFSSSQITVDATERNLEKIAEALKNALKLKQDLPITDVRQIIDLRNLINHTYFKVNHAKIWLIITEHLPLLETQVREILEDYERRLASNEL